MKLKGFPQAVKAIKDKAFKVLANEGVDTIKEYLDDMIDLQRDASGKPLPTKADSTKRAYAREGWNTEDWLVRTGKASQWKVKKTRKVIKVTPGKDYLKYVKGASDFFTLNKAVVESLINDLKKGLK